MSQWSITIWIEYGLVCLVDTLQHFTFGRIQIFIIKTWSTPEFGWQWMFDQNEEICFILLALLSTALVAAHVVPFTLTCLFCEISEHKTHLTLNSQFTFHFLPCLLPSSSTSTTSCASLSPFWQKQPPHWPAVPQCATVCLPPPHTDLPTVPTCQRPRRPPNVLGKGWVGSQPIIRKHWFLNYDMLVFTINTTRSHRTQICQFSILLVAIFLIQPPK